MNKRQIYTKEDLPKERLDAVPFWGGFMSNWYPSNFTIGDLEYNCVEQHMMLSKALFFRDMESAEKIMEEDSPRFQKKLGRKVANFDAEQWREHCYRRCIPGVHAKFQQNPELADKLLATEYKVLIEASPYDRIWGIGKPTDSDDCFYVDKWDGDNLLGFMLMEVRDWIR